MAENIAFTERVIADVQKRPLDLKAQAITDYLMRFGRLAYDLAHKLWWVNHPSQGWQVAVWLTDACEELSEEERASISVSQFAQELVGGR
jgi:hypothetical protein